MRFTSRSRPLTHSLMASETFERDPWERTIHASGRPWHKPKGSRDCNWHRQERGPEKAERLCTQTCLGAKVASTPDACPDACHPECILSVAVPRDKPGTKVQRLLVMPLLQSSHGPGLSRRKARLAACGKAAPGGIHVHDGADGIAWVCLDITNVCLKTQISNGLLVFALTPLRLLTKFGCAVAPELRVPPHISQKFRECGLETARGLWYFSEVLAEPVSSYHRVAALSERLACFVQCESCQQHEKPGPQSDQHC